MSPEVNKNRRAERAFKWPQAGFQVFKDSVFSFEPLSRHGNLIVCRKCMGQGKQISRTAIADFSVWPPDIRWLPEHSHDAVFSPSGKLVTNADDTGQMFYTARLRSSPADDTFQLLSHSDSSLVGRFGYYSCAFWKEQVVTLLHLVPGINQTQVRYPLFQQGNQLVEDKRFQPAEKNFLARVARTGDGSEILIWGEHGHESFDGNDPARPLGNRFSKTFTLMGPVTHLDWTCVPAGPDGFYYVYDDVLYEIHRGNASVPHLPKNKNIMHVRPGPDGALLLREGYKKGADLARLYWPESKEVIRLKTDLLPEIHSDNLDTLFWLEDKRRFIVFVMGEVWFIPWEEIENLPRTKIQ